MVHLENIFLKNVLLYLPTLKDIGKFAQICKSCEEVINTIYVNPYNLTLYQSFDKIIRIFPNLQTLYLRRCPEKLYKISTNNIPLIEIGRWSEISKPTKVFDTKWFCSKIRKLRININFSIKFELKHPEYFTQLQELIILNDINLNTTIKLFKLSSLKKVIIFCSINKLYEISELFNFNQNKQINFIIILYQNGFTNNNLLNQIDYNEFINCTFYTRIFNKSTINFPYLPLLPYEPEILMNFNNNNYDIIIESNILDKINQINEIVLKNNIQKVLIENILNDFEGTKIDLTTLYIEFLSIIEIKKQNLNIIFPPNLKSLTIKYCDASIDISKCHLTNLILNNYQGKSIEIHDENLEKVKVNSKQEVKWYHNGTLLKQNEIYLDMNKISLLSIDYYDNFINNRNNNNNTKLQTFIFKYNDKETILSNIQLFNFKDNNIVFWNCKGQEVDLSEFPFHSIELQNCEFKYLNIKCNSISLQNCQLINLKVKCNSINLNNIKCNILTLDGVCDRSHLYNCKINTFTCDIIRYLTYTNSQINVINANEIKSTSGPKTNVKIWNIKNLN
ncbi:hypothetical protein EDI_026200 [Entamoeba dispar SAW760]|uniref:F-box domain-containing protein n=1 Tax=Entamoeba dispar (strain ATCC PRA-260 / SAW760) TaxID=370354 RepID=B0EKR3_ENTDS|nr:uncharacterized protein EDI_026200 [Entamoeba dispar SAW760]EDR24886.1 hypothetical protein EDI_026200 [Entamoeba dispar SAW760]|eukprot:EDR24886.1 hypothetical protein EDI_026200 [Entamoeba dispar SAW760]